MLKRHHLLTASSICAFYILLAPHVYLESKKGAVTIPREAAFHHYLSIDQPWVVLIVIGGIFFPVLFTWIILYKKQKKTFFNRLFFLSSGFFLLLECFYLYFLMVFHLFDNVELLLPAYITLSYFILYALWSILLAIPWFDRFTSRLHPTQLLLST